MDCSLGQTQLVPAEQTITLVDSDHFQLQSQIDY